MKTRSDDLIFGILLRKASSDDNVRAVLLNGSRVNPSINPDPMQDFDVVFLVRSVEEFMQQMDPGFFGRIMIMQTPDELVSKENGGDGHFTYLMQFMDGTRIDLTVHPVENLFSSTSDSLTRVLLDKDGTVGKLPPPDESSYFPSRPGEGEFMKCCNEFWWVSPYVAKGLWRGEVLYARHMLEGVLRKELMKILVWRFGIRTGFSRSPGKLCRNLKDYMDPGEWQVLMSTCPDWRSSSIWDSLLAMGELFREAALEVAAGCRYSYPGEDDRSVTDYLRHIRTLPADADTIY